MRRPEDQELYDAGRLIQFGLRPDARPVTDPEYRELMDRFLDRLEFRHAVEHIARGLGLWILEHGQHGIAFAPFTESVFSMKTSDWRITPGTTVEGRLLDGLVQVGIAATLYPRATDLEDEAARPPITVEDVDATLRLACARLEEEARGRPDPEVSRDGAGLEEAWRVYAAMPPVTETKDGRRSPNTSRALIERAFEFLRRHGCFARTVRDGQAAFQSNWRYEVLAREFASTAIYDRITEALAAAPMEDA